MKKPRPQKLLNAQMPLSLSNPVLQGLTRKERREVIEHLAQLLREAIGIEGEADDER
jgi:hypothetical protein